MDVNQKFTYNRKIPSNPTDLSVPVSSLPTKVRDISDFAVDKYKHKSLQSDEKVVTHKLMRKLLKSIEIQLGKASLFDIDFSVACNEKKAKCKVVLLRPAVNNGQFQLGFLFCEQKCRSRRGMMGCFMHVTHFQNERITDVSYTCVSF